MAPRARASDDARDGRPKSILKTSSRRASVGSDAATSARAPALLDVEDSIERRDLRLPAMRAPVAGTERAEACALAVERSTGATSRSDARGVFVGRRETLAALEAHAAGDGAPNVLVLESARGAGSSSVLAEFAKGVRERAAMMVAHEEATGETVSEKKPLAVLACCRGPTPGECDFQHVLWVWCERLRKMLGRKRFYRMPETVEETGRCFARLLEELATTTTSVVVLVVDDLDAAEGLEAVRVSSWLPSSMIRDVRVVIGVQTKGTALNYLASAGEQAASIARKQLPPLSYDDRSRVARGLFSGQNERHISPELFAPIVDYKDGGSPSYLYFAAHELRRRVAMHAGRNDAPLDVAHELRQFPQTIEQLLTYVFDGLEQRHGYDPVRQLMTMLLSTRSGYTLSEMAEIMGMSKSSSAFFALTNDVAHMCWYYEDGSQTTEIAQDALILRYSHVIECATRRYMSDGKVGPFQREITTYFLRKSLDKNAASLDAREVLEVLHLTGTGQWPSAREQLVGYMTNPDVIHFFWAQNRRSDLRVSYARAVQYRRGQIEHAYFDKLLNRLGRLKDRALGQCVVSCAGFMSWVNDHRHVVSVCEQAFQQKSLEKLHLATLGLKHAKALRRLEMWDEAIEAAKLARGYESVNFNGNTPLGAMIAHEESLCLAQTTDERLARDNHSLRGGGGFVAEILGAAAQAAQASLNAWRLCSKDRTIADATYHIVVITNNLATMHGLRDERAREIELHEALIDEVEQSVGANHHATYQQTLRLSDVYATYAEWGKSEFCLEHALKYCVDVYPDHSTELLENLRRLARVYALKGDFVSSREVYEELLQEMSDTSMSSKHEIVTEFVVEIYTELARALHKLKDLEDAKRTFEKALDVTRRRFGESYSGTADRFSDLASVELELGHYDEAQTLFRRALDIETQRLGSDHPSLAKREMNLASVFKIHGDIREVYRLYHSAEKLLKRSDERVHPEIAVTLNALGEAYEDLDKLEKAEPLYGRAVTIAEQDFHAGKHLDTYAMNLGRCHLAQQRLMRARICFTQALENAESKYHANDLRLASIRAELGAVNAEMKEWSLAKDHYARAKEIRAAVLGNDHADTLSIVQSMEMVQSALDEVELRKGKVQVRVANYEDITSRSTETTPTKADAKNADREAFERARMERDMSLLAETFRALKKNAQMQKKTRKDLAAQNAFKKLAALTALKGNVQRAATERGEQNAVASPSPTRHVDEEEVTILRSSTTTHRAEASGMSDVDGFLAEFVVYLGHRRYRFKLDGKEFAEFAHVRQHVAANYADECRRWSSGEVIEPFVKRPVATAPAATPKPKVEHRETTIVQPVETSNHVTPRGVYSKPPIVESPQSGATDGPSGGNQVKSPTSEETPQSKMHPVVISNGMVQISSQEYEYNIAKIDLLERELTAMREMMMRMSYAHSNGSTENVSGARPSHKGAIEPIASSAPDLAQNQEYWQSTGYDAAQKHASRVSQRRLYDTPPAAKQFVLVHDPSSTSPGSLPKVQKRHKVTRKLIRLDAAVPSKPTNPSIESAAQLRRKISEADMDAFVQMNSNKVAPMRYQCAFDGVTLSTSAMLRNHFERFHVDDAREFVKSKLEQA